jgi:SAM-dependent methyltransferase
MRISDVGKEQSIDIKKYFDSISGERIKWRKRAGYFHGLIKKYLSLSIPKGSSIFEFGCEEGDLLASLEPSRGTGIDFSRKLILKGREKYPHLEFIDGDIEDFVKTTRNSNFDYAIIGNTIGYVEDIQNTFSQLKTICRPDTRVIVLYYNFLWEPLLKLAEALGLRMKRPRQHWFLTKDLENFLNLAGFETIKNDNYILIPFYIPLISGFVNKYLANIGFFRLFSLIQVICARPSATARNISGLSCSVIVPCRNEKGNIEKIVTDLPIMGKGTEIIFVEGHSKDGTLSECERVMKAYSDKEIKVFVQDGEGKGNAVRCGFSKATGDILMILDADLTVPPEELPKFFNVLASGKGEFVNGSRLVYKMEGKAMRFLNLLGNKFFSFMFTFLLEQYIKDTLCGSKALWRKDYERIVKGRVYFGDFDPFGDFDLLFGAAKLNLKIVEVPVHYRQRSYGATQIKRFTHGWLLLRMTFIAMNKLKFL